MIYLGQDLGFRILLGQDLGIIVCYFWNFINFNNDKIRHLQSCGNK